MSQNQQPRVGRRTAVSLIFTNDPRTTDYQFMKSSLSVAEAHEACGIASLRSATKRRRANHKPKEIQEAASASRVLQPVIESEANVRCPLCNSPVDPRRMQPHMVRFHGAAMP